MPGADQYKTGTVRTALPHGKSGIPEAGAAGGAPVDPRWKNGSQNSCCALLMMPSVYGREWRAVNQTLERNWEYLSGLFDRLFDKISPSVILSQT